MKPTEQSCENCGFYEVKTEITGKCKLFPPVRVATGLSAFPTVPPTEWCGQWQVREESQTVPEPVSEGKPNPPVELVQEEKPVKTAGKSARKIKPPAPPPTPALAPEPETE